MSYSFDEEKFTRRDKNLGSGGNKFANFIIKISGGLIRNPSQANLVLIVFIIISFIIIFINIGSPSGNSLQGVYYPEQFDGNDL